MKLLGQLLLILLLLLHLCKPLRYRRLRCFCRGLRDVEQVERAQEAEKEEDDDAEEGAAEVVEQSEGDKTCSRLHDIQLRICTISPMPEAVHKRLECGEEADELRLGPSFREVEGSRIQIYIFLLTGRDFSLTCSHKSSIFLFPCLIPIPLSISKV